MIELLKLVATAVLCAFGAAIVIAIFWCICAMIWAIYTLFFEKESTCKKKCTHDDIVLVGSSDKSMIYKCVDCGNFV